MTRCATVFLCVASCTLAGTADEARTLGPKIKCSKVITGSVIAGYSKTFMVTVSNEGQSDLIIERVVTSCGCTVAGTFKARIAPGEAGGIPIVYTPRRESGVFKHHIMIKSNDRQCAVARAIIQGTIVQPKDFSCSRNRMSLCALVGEGIQTSGELVISSKKEICVTEVSNPVQACQVAAARVDKHSVILKFRGISRDKPGIWEGNVRIRLKVDGVDKEIEVPLLTFESPT